MQKLTIDKLLSFCDVVYPHLLELVDRRFQLHGFHKVPVSEPTGKLEEDLWRVVAYLDYRPADASQTSTVAVEVDYGQVKELSVLRFCDYLESQVVSANEELLEFISDGDSMSDFDQWWAMNRKSDKAVLSEEDWARKGWEAQEERLRSQRAQRDATMMGLGAAGAVKTEPCGIRIWLEGEQEPPRGPGGTLACELGEVDEQLKLLDQDMKELYQRISPVLRPASPTPCNPDSAPKSPEQEGEVVRVIRRWVRELMLAREFVREMIDRCEV